MLINRWENAWNSPSLAIIAAQGSVWPRATECRGLLTLNGSLSHTMRGEPHARPGGSCWPHAILLGAALNGI